MKKVLLSLLIIIGLNAAAQQDIYFKINHQLGSAPFAYNQSVSTAQSSNFIIDRFQYYISEIQLTYDGGQDTTLNTYLLIDAAQTTNELLGNFNISKLESIRFGIGVDPSQNNNDPNLWPMNHPLAMQSPSMHWGWAAGYFFATAEGKSGDSQTGWQIHALGNRNYKTQEIITTGLSYASYTSIEINADYKEAFNNIVITDALINHGEAGEAAILLTNFNTSVFSAGTVGLNERTLERFKLFPNPSNGEVFLQFENNQLGNELIIQNLKGQTTHRQIISKEGLTRISIEESGTYLINLFKNGSLIGSEKVIIQD